MLPICVTSALAENNCILYQDAVSSCTSAVTIVTDSTDYKPVPSVQGRITDCELAHQVQMLIVDICGGMRRSWNMAKHMERVLQPRPRRNKSSCAALTSF
jgi:hypothetical protein